MSSSASNCSSVRSYFFCRLLTPQSTIFTDLFGMALFGSAGTSPKVLTTSWRRKKLRFCFILCSHFGLIKYTHYLTLPPPPFAFGFFFCFVLFLFIFFVSMYSVLKWHSLALLFKQPRTRQFLYIQNIFLQDCSSSVWKNLLCFVGSQVIQVNSLSLRVCVRVLLLHKNLPCPWWPFQRQRVCRPATWPCWAIWRTGNHWCPCRDWPSKRRRRHGDST